MPLLDLLRIPCILVTTWGLDTTNTPPAVAPTKTKQPRNTASTIILGRILQLLPYVKAIFWIIASAEIAVIVSRQCPAPLVPSALRHASEVNLHLSTTSIIGMCLVAGGTLVRIQCYRALEKFFTFEISIHKDHKLITSGPYSIVRHPSYTAVVAVYAGGALWYACPGSYLLESGIMDTVAGKTIVGMVALFFSLIIISLLRRMGEEDVVLHKVFGEAWEKWAQRVPYSIIPFLY